MRGWLAALAFVPAVAWGQVPSDCMSTSSRQTFTEMAIEIRDAIDSGASEDSLLEWASKQPQRGVQAAAYGAIDAYTFPHGPRPKVSQVVTAMQYYCHREYRD